MTPGARSIIMLVVGWVFVASWTAAVSLLMVNPPPGSRERLLFTMATMLGIGTLGLLVLVGVLGDRLRTVSDGYLVGYAHGRSDGQDETAGWPLRPVK